MTWVLRGSDGCGFLTFLHNIITSSDSCFGDNFIDPLDVGIWHVNVRTQNYIMEYRQLPQTLTLKGPSDDYEDQ